MTGQLFDVDRTVTQQCPACGAVRQPGDAKADNCAADLERDQHPRRPTECLNTYRPEHTPIPY